ncbi:MAG: AAA family ATPase [Nannocystaceae bacterium]|nr:AAA family ATPase [Deltaproteobacteria bacterium]MBP7286919.1 AAA family ATPase [Nannocystaceae bacterium]
MRHGNDNDRPSSSNVRRLTRLDREDVRAAEPTSPTAPPVASMLSAWWMLLRQRWWLALAVMILVATPIGLYAAFAVPTYTAQGVLQVSATQGGIDPMLELVGGGGAAEVETEVEIIRRREFVLGVFKDLRLQLVDPHQPGKVTTDPHVSLGGRTPTSEKLAAVRQAVRVAEVSAHAFESVELTLSMLDDDHIALDIGPDDARTHHEFALGETFDDAGITLAFDAAPLTAGDAIDLRLVPDGELADKLMPDLVVAAIGDRRQLTNLVSISFSHPDRDIAQAVVDAIMARYVAQSLSWQAEGAAKAAEFIHQRLQEAEQELRADEEQLRSFAEREKAVQLDTQARVTIENAAALEAEQRQAELQETVLGSVISGLKSRDRHGEGAHLTANFFDDPVLGAAITSLTEGETKHAVLRATLTADHPEVRELGAQLELQRKEVGRLLRSAKQNLGARKREIARQLETASASLAAYPDKDLQMARLMRDVEVSQKLYTFLLERHREAEIVEASTTVDKRVVDPASLPHRIATPKRGRLAATGLVSALAAAFAAVWLANAMQRRLHTVEAVKREFPVAVYGSVPELGRGDNETKAEAKRNGGSVRARLDLDNVWSQAHGVAAEAFRALCVSVTLAPGAPGRGRVVQITSSQPGEGKSTVIANLAVALRKSGARVLVVDLDLRKPVQHRQWKQLRAPGYSDLVAAAGGDDAGRKLVHTTTPWEVDVLCAGSKLPDTLSSLMTPLLDGLLAQWAAQYDYVLLDSPPAFVPDTTVVAKHVDLLLMVVRPGVVERASLRQAVAALERVQVNRGLVLNGVTRRHSEDYYGSSYYSYGNVYGEGSDDDRRAVAS